MARSYRRGIVRICGHITRLNVTDFGNTRKPYLVPFSNRTVLLVKLFLMTGGALSLTHAFSLSKL